ncbi:DUF2313 domain-containing protein, partial [Escherichia coli]|nr:DUF2313 domain-containing protein [Escherichia coli]
MRNRMSRFSHDDYTRAMLNLLPSGIAWSRLPDSVQHRLIRGLAQAYRKSDADACALITGAFPETADALTDEWYASLGLNDECGTQASTTDPAQARKFILAKLLSTGGQSVAYFTELAATMGYSISIREYRTPLCGFSWSGHLLSDDNRFNWTVVVAPPGDEVTTSRAYLECLFRRYAPAHTLVTFEWQSSYSAALSIAWDNITHVLSGALTADEGVVVSGVTVNVVIKSASGQRYVATVTTDSEGHWSYEMEDDDFANGWYSAYAEAAVDMPDDVTVPVRSEVINLRKIVSVRGVNLSVTELELDNDEHVAVAVNVWPENAEDRSWTVTVSDESVVSVVVNSDSSLTVCGVSEGDAVVTVTTNDGGHTATLQVSCYVPAVFDSVCASSSKALVSVADVVNCRVSFGDGYVAADQLETTTSGGWANILLPDSLADGELRTIRVRTAGSVRFRVYGYSSTAYNDLVRLRQLPAGQKSCSYLASNTPSLVSIDSGAFRFCKNATAFDSAFYRCKGLTAIPPGLFAECASATTFYQAFYECTGLTAVGDSAFAGCTGVTTFRQAFYGCTGLRAVGESVFAGCTGATTFEDTFYGCTGLSTVGNSVFAGCTSATTFYRVFYNCRELSTVGNSVFAGCASATTFLQAFYGCQALTSLGQGIFADCTGVTTFLQAFYNCRGLTALPEGMFDSCTAVTTFSNAFYGCTALTAIPEGLFDSCTGVTTFNRTFYGCAALTAIPAKLFANCTEVATFEGVFSGCSGLVTIPAGLFEKLTSVTTFDSAFYGCRALTTVGDRVFAGCTGTTTFASVFEGCTGLVTIPADVFAGCSGVRSFYRSFFGCTGLAMVPPELFADCTGATTFYTTFYRCTRLSEVPAELFSGCTGAKSFYKTFGECTGLSEVPARLFADCTGATTFEGVFSGCRGLTTIPAGLFANSASVTTFFQAFYECTGL